MKSLSILVLHLALCSSTVWCLDEIDDGASFLASFGPVLAPLAIKGSGEPQSNSANNATDSKYEALDIMHMSMSGILAHRGYDAQVHYAVTKDGYYIHLIRIINPLLGGNPAPKRPVLFNHGLLESSAIWLLNSRGVKPENKASLCETLPIDLEVAKNQTEFLNGPMLLANRGYDVWLMSMRGTDYSMYHKKWDSSAPAFWDYSLDNFALDDVPSCVNYIRRYTGSKKVAYVGHSQATFSVFGLLATRPHYAEIIEPVFAVAPVAYMYHLTSFATPSLLQELATPNQQGPMPEKARQIRARFGQFCGKNAQLATSFACDMVDSMLGGKGKGSLRGFLSFFPYHTSHKVMRHFGQIISGKRFGMYDHGPQENLKRYGTKEAPPYKVANIRSRSINLIWTKTDSLSDPRDVDRFKSELTVPLHRDIFIDREFNHFDLITDDDARYLVFAPMLEILEEFEQREGGVCEREGGGGAQQAGDNHLTGGKDAGRS